MNKLLIVFNTCGIQQEHPASYITNINSILDQNFTNFKVAISSCQNSEQCENSLINTFGNNVSYNFIHNRVPISITFNHTVQKCIEKFGKFNCYLYVDSGIDFIGSENYINDLYALFESDQYGIVSARADQDTGFDFLYNVSIRGDELFTQSHFTIPVGQTLNLHAQIFSNQFIDTYNRILPDIFAGQCMESVFSFMCAAIQTKWIVHKDVVLHHQTGMDGPSGGFAPHIWEMQGNKRWDHLFETNESILDIIERGKGFGMGYEEFESIVMHDPNKFDNNGYAIDNRLKTYIRDNLFLTQNQFDYNKINHIFI